jgi:hypothetical protein
MGIRSGRRSEASRGLACRLSAEEASRKRSGFRRSLEFARGERGRRDEARAGRESLFSLVIFSNLLNGNVGDYTLAMWNGTGVERDLVNFLDYEREIELAKVNTLEGDEEVVVMKN